MLVVNPLPAAVRQLVLCVHHLAAMAAVVATTKANKIAKTLTKTATVRHRTKAIKTATVTVKPTRSITTTMTTARWTNKTRTTMAMGCRIVKIATSKAAARATQTRIQIANSATRTIQTANRSRAIRMIQTANNAIRTIQTANSRAIRMIQTANSATRTIRTAANAIRTIRTVANVIRTTRTATSWFD